MLSSTHLFSHCLQLLENRRKTLIESIESVQLAANSETKSSAGDKHETARAMAQLDVEMLSKQLSEVARSIESMKRLPRPGRSDFVQHGSVVETSIGTFYVSVGLGTVEIAGFKIMAVSSESPLAKAILGKQKGDQLDWNGKTLTVISVAN